MVRLLLSLYHGFTKITPVIGRILSGITAPLRAVGRFLFRTVVVPAYHLLLLIRRRLHGLYLPAKSKILFVFSNRYAIHGAMAMVSIFAIATNIITTIQPAEAQGLSYHQESILTVVLSHGTTETLEEVTAITDPRQQATPTSYRGEVAFSAPITREINFESIGTEPGIGTSVVARASDASSSNASRKETITYTIAEGDTISTIAERFGLSVPTVLWSNNLSVRSTIRPGNTLTILPGDGTTHTVKSGDTLSRIAKLYQADADKIQSANALASANDLHVGETLFVPDGQQPATASTSRSVASVGSLFTAAPVNSTSVAKPSSSGFVWPGELSRINTWFHQYYAFGLHTGLDIACSHPGNKNVSSNINHAASDGIVIYSGWNGGGYGNLVQIQHDNGLVTYYGHNAKLYVQKGETVTKGQAVGLCGSTGLSTAAHLHFEVRANGTPVNPLLYVSP